MTVLNTRELLSQLSKIENSLNQFSFEELSTSEASELKKTFESFKNGLESKVFESHETETVVVNTNSPRTVVAESSIIANVSHEIRTPLNGIVGFIDLLQETKLTKEQKELVNALGLASNNLMTIINELLEFSKLSADKESHAAIEFNFKNLIKELSFLSKTLIVNENVAFNLSIDKNIPEVILGDPSKLSQILLNLLGNAVKFVEKGAINFSATLKSITKDSLVIAFEISDTGIGIAKDKLERIFDSYQQAETDTHLKYGGSGLGLSIVKALIEQLRGSIVVSSFLGKGTSFKLEIPYKKAAQKIKSNQKIESSVIKNSDVLAGMTILVFEDNELNQKLIASRLDSWGCKSIVTAKSAYGLKVLDTHKIDLVLMDLRMPGITGFEITTQIRNNSNKTIKSIPIIALSADFKTSDKEQFKLLEINDFILKPFKPKDLLEKIIKNKSMMEREAKIQVIKPMSKTNAISEKLSLDIVLEDCMGKVELLDELIILFKKNILEFIGRAKVNLLNDNLDGVFFNAHKIKSGLRMLKLDGLIEITEQICLASKTTKDTKHLNFLYEEFIKEYEIIAPQIEAEIIRIKNK